MICLTPLVLTKTSLKKDTFDKGLTIGGAIKQSLIVKTTTSFEHALFPWYSQALAYQQNY